MAPSVSYSHVHLYVDSLQPLSAYKKLEDDLNQFSEECESRGIETIDEKILLWRELTGCDENEEFLQHQRDIVKQLLVGFNFRITGARSPGMLSEDGEAIETNTRSFLVTSKDPFGIQFLITAAVENDDQGSKIVNDKFHHFDAAQVETFMGSHDNRQGIAGLAFLVDNVAAVESRYKKLHPNLVAHYGSYPDNNTNDTKVLEVYAYYKEHDEGLSAEEREADTGTILRFMQISSGAKAKTPPGLVRQEAKFSSGAVPAYSDHWVSNVISRTEFLDILNDTLDFSPKVDFNAGVVAAGEAQIESTVTGNTSQLTTADKEEVLRDQGQVFLPINNALSEVGHVHLFLRELGQGVQHVASRVQDLVGFVQATNERRAITGEGFTFLNIPRSYYGILSFEDIEKVVCNETAMGIWSALEAANFIGTDGAVGLDVSEQALEALLVEKLPEQQSSDFHARKEEVVKVILTSRFKNLYSLLGHHLSEETYMGIVRNKVLVDIQGEDLLLQIFTCKILHREAVHEAPFLEFIQRVCSECKDESGCPQKIRPGCGGFGIRNFLTLFLSIEVSKAMQAAASARASGDTEKEEYEKRRVECFTSQLNESNPILTSISESMTEEGILRDRITSAATPEEREELAKQIKLAEERKLQGNQKLMETSAKYNSLMKALRTDQEKNL